MYTTSVAWSLLIVGLLIAAEVGRSTLRERRARREAIRRGRTLTAKYGMPWRRPS